MAAIHFGPQSTDPTEAGSSLFSNNKQVSYLFSQISSHKALHSKTERNKEENKCHKSNKKKNQVMTL